MTKTRFRINRFAWGPNIYFGVYDTRQHFHVHWCISFMEAIQWVYVREVLRRTPNKVERRKRQRPLQGVARGRLAF